MMKLTNKGRRRLGVPGRPAIVLGPNESKPVSEVQLEAMRKNNTVVRWLETGVLVLTDGADVVEVEVEEERPSRPAAKPGIKAAAKPIAGRRKGDERQEQVLPEGVTGTGVELHHTGGGWWDVYVNSFQVTDRRVRKEEAEAIAKEYE